MLLKDSCALKSRTLLCQLFKIFLFFFLVINVDAQDLSWSSRGEDLPTLRDCSFPDTFDGRTHLLENLATCRLAAQEAGYMAASFDSLSIKADSASWSLFLGPKFEWLNLDLSALEDRYRKKIGGLPKAFSGRALQLKELKYLQEQIIRLAEEEGYPFASVYWRDIVWDSTQVSARMEFEKGDRVRVDSIILIGSANVSSRFLQNYLGVKAGSPYRESSIKTVASRLDELSFLKTIQSPEVVFTGKNAKLRVYAERKNASSFDLLLGLLPQGSNGDYELSGEGRIDLVNTLGAAEEMGIHYKNFPGAATELKTYFNYPYLPGVPLGLELRFNIYKKDTLFSEVDFQIGFEYRMQRNDRVKVFFESKQTNLLSIDSLAFLSRNPPSLPNNHDVDNRFYGLNFIRDRRNYTLNPRSGYRIELEAAIGQKSIPKNNSLLSITNNLADGSTVEQLYENTDEEQLQVRLIAHVSKFWPLGARSTIFSGLRLASMQRIDGAQQVYDNERFRIGGNRLLRGFDEESILTDRYAMLTLEYRFLLDRNSNFFLFGDLARIENSSAELTIDQQFEAYGIGAGLSFQTGAGIFAFSYGLGAQKGNGFQFRSGKVHLGYVNYF